MKLQVRILHNGKLEGKETSLLVVCDDKGEPLPNQTTVELYNSVTDVAKVSVTFTIDGELVRLVGREVGANGSH